MSITKFIKDLKERRKEQIKIKKCDEFKKAIRAYQKKLPEKEFPENPLYIGPDIPSDILEPIINDMGYYIIEERDFFEGFINFIINKPSHEFILKSF